MKKARCCRHGLHVVLFPDVDNTIPPPEAGISDDIFWQDGSPAKFIVRLRGVRFQPRDHLVKPRVGGIVESAVDRSPVMLDTDELWGLVFAAVLVEVILGLFYHQSIPVDPYEFAEFTQCPDAHPVFHEVSRIILHECRSIFEGFGDLEPKLGERSRAVSIPGENGKHVIIAWICPEAKGYFLEGLSRLPTSPIATVIIKTSDEWRLTWFRHTWFYR